MSADDPLLQPVIVLRVVIRSPDLDTFVAKYSRFVKDDRIFIFTKSSQPPGTQVRFTLELSDGQPLIHGEGTVTRVRPESDDSSKPPGMELKFVPLDARSRELVARMLRARDETGGFRRERSDVQTQVQVRLPLREPGPEPLRTVDSRPVTLPPLAGTGAHELPPRQDESGAVTLAQGLPPGMRAEMPSGSFTPPHATLAPPAAGKLPSDSFVMPTPLPAPIPAGSEESFVGASDGTGPTRRDDAEAANPFAALGPAPPFAESFRGPLPNAPASALPTSTVPANPFSEVSDGAIEYFVEWSLEQSRAPKPKDAEASFANVRMATPRAARQRSARGPLLVGLLLGLVVGVPLGAGAMWYWSAPALQSPPPSLAAAPSPPAAAPSPAVAAPSPSGAPAAALPPPPSGSAVAAPSPPASVPAAPSPSGRVAAAPSPSASATAAPPPSGRVAAAPSPPASVPAAPSPAGSAAAAPSPSGRVAAAPSPPASAAAAPSPAGSAAAAPSPSPTANGAPTPAAAAGATAELQVTSKPSGAQVNVDGQERGRTPLALPLTPGPHELSLTKERYATLTATVTAPAKLDLTLKRPTATLHVESDPAGGDVVVEGRPRGKTPVDVTLEAFHHYDVQVTLAGGHAWHKRVSLKPPQTDVTARLSSVHAE